MPKLTQAEKHELEEATRDLQVGGTITIERAAPVEGAEGDSPPPAVYGASFSSEEPEGLWFGNRIIKHGAGAADLSRVKKGIVPLLWNHDRMEVIGKVLDADIKNKRGVCRFEFDETPEAQKVKGQVDRGVVVATSVGLTATKVAWVEKDGAEDMVVEAWILNEISIVSVPADTSVGIGKAQSTSTSTRRETMSDDNSNNGAAAAASTQSASSTEATIVDIQKAAEDGRKEGGAAELQRVRDIQAQSRMFKNLPADEIMTLERSAIDNGKDWRAYSDMLVERAETILKENPKALNTPTTVGMSEKETRRYSVARAIGLHCGVVDEKDASLEAEIQKHMNEHCPSRRGPDAMQIPYEVLSTREVDPSRNAAIRRDLTGTTTVLGGALISEPVIPSEYISTLRDRALTVAAGVRVINVNGMNIKLPRRTSNATFQWVGYDTDTTDTDQMFDQVSLEMKVASGSSSIGRELLKQSNPSVDSLILEDLAIGAALAVDDAVLSGAGGDAPEGIEHSGNHTALTHTDSSGLTYAEALTMVATLGQNNALAGMPCFFMRYADWAKLSAKTKVGTYPVFLIDNSMAGDPRMVGYPVKMKSNGITAKHIILGNFSDSVLAMWGGPTLMRDTAAKSKSGGIVLRCFVDADFAVRHPASFVVSTGS